MSGKSFFAAAGRYGRDVEESRDATTALCHSRYQHASGIAGCAQSPHHLGMHKSFSFTWTTSQATEDTQYFQCGYCGCTENPLRCGCDHEGDAVPHQQPAVAPS